MGAKDEITNIAPDSDLMVEQLVSVERVSLNVSQSLILTTEDKLKICLNSHVKKIEKSKEWVAPFSLLSALLLSLITADFKQALLSPETWRALFIIAALLSGVWLLFSLRNSFQSRSIDTVIDEIRNNAQHSPNHNTVRDS